MVSCQFLNQVTCTLSTFYEKPIIFLDRSGQFRLVGDYKLKEDNIQRIHCISSSLDDMYLAITVSHVSKGTYNAPSANTAAVESQLHQKSTLAMLASVMNSAEESKAEEPGRLEIYIFNFAVVDAVKTIYKDPFEPLFEKD